MFSLSTGSWSHFINFGQKKCSAAEPSTWPPAAAGAEGEQCTAASLQVLASDQDFVELCLQLLGQPQEALGRVAATACSFLAASIWRAYQHAVWAAAEGGIESVESMLRVSAEGRVVGALCRGVATGGAERAAGGWVDGVCNTHVVNTDQIWKI